MVGWGRMLSACNLGYTGGRDTGLPEALGMFGFSFALRAMAAGQDAWAWRSDNSGSKPPELLQGLKQPLT